jgi:hypothetical protein
LDILGIFPKNGGERGIRTLGAAFDSTHDFQSCSFGQLGHLSKKNFAKFFLIKLRSNFMAEGVRFELTESHKALNGFRGRRLQPLGHPSR